jgi:hypothetical protein
MVFRGLGIVCCGVATVKVTMEEANVGASVEASVGANG